MKELYRIALDHDREIAAEIGLLLSCYAIIDLFILHIFSLVCDLDKDTADIILGRLKGNGQRIELILDLLRNSERMEKDFEIELMKQVIVATKRRNEYAHSIYSQVSDGPTNWRMSMWLSDGGKRKKEFKNISISIVREDCAFIRSVLESLFHFGQIQVIYE